MLIKNLTPKEIESFVKTELGLKVYSCDYDDVRGWIVNVTDSTNKRDRQIMSCVVLKDFNITHQLQNVDYEELNHNWACFLYSKFGERFKEAYNQNLKEKYEDELIK